MFDELSSSGSIPALEKLIGFAAQRQRLLSHNIANISTPDFRQMDVSVKGFQGALRQAILERRERTGGQAGELNIQETREIAIGPGGRLILRPRTNGEGILAHDRNNRDLETLMKDLVENAATFRLASDLLKSRMDLIRAAISERV
jgi:flagellar basal-body rod protein FlgB